MRLPLEVSEEAMRRIALAEYDPVYGARPLKRAIRREIENPLAMRLIEGGLREGDAVVVTWTLKAASASSIIAQS